MINGLVTVVVPVYNVERYLDRCISSIVNQTYTDLEVILVDDGSPDRCPQMCDEWAKKDARIKVIHKKNAGLGMARNTGIENAKGEYICFFDSDDYIEPVTIEECYRAIKEEFADIVCFGNDRVTPDGRVLERRVPAPPQRVFEGEKVVKELFPQTVSYNPQTGVNWRLSWSAWCAMFSIRVIRKYEWKFVSEREYISEDYYSLASLYTYISKAVIISKVFYHYTVNTSSLSRTYKEDRFEKLSYFYREIQMLCKRLDTFKYVECELGIVFLWLSIGYLKQIVDSKQGIWVRLAKLKKVIFDPVIQDVVWKNDFASENLPRKMICFAIRKRAVILSFIVVKLRNIRDRMKR